ncbi:MAG: SdrD B-like domain-containing protein [Blastocatellia bacterium]|nr:SdrD B-like domain-containing protein [Blastocatellia bacterium]
MLSLTGVWWAERPAAAQSNLIDLSLVKLVSARPLGGYRGGLQIVYQLTVTNATTCRKNSTTTEPCVTATGVTVKDLLPAGLTFAGASTLNYNATSGIWTVGNLSPGQSQVLQIATVINANAVGNIVNYAQVQKANQNDSDSIPGDDSKNEDDDSSVTITVIAVKSSLAGNVYVDGNNNGVKDSGEAGIGGATLTLTGTDSQGAAVALTTTTQASGAYIFSDLNAGTYKVAETQPAGYLDGKDALGSAGGTLGNDLVTNIALAAGVNAVNYNFGEIAGFVDLSLTKSHPANFTAGSSGLYSLTVFNAGNFATSGTITVTDTLPAGMTFASATGTGWTCAPNGQAVVCTSTAALAPSASATINLTVNVAAQIASSVVNTATVSVQGDANSTNNTANDPTTILPAPTTPPPPTANPCATDAGSVLLFPLYTSDAINPLNENTRISMTNTNQNRPISVHIFFVDGSSCNVSDGYVCLTQNQTLSFLTSDFDPGTTGYFVAVAVDELGCPTSFNHLIGQADIHFANGQNGMIPAENFQALYTGNLPGCDANSSMATLPLDGLTYSQPANQLAIPMIPSIIDGNNPLLVLVRTGGNLAFGAAPIGSIFGILYNDAENTFSFSFSSTSCQFKQAFTGSFPRTVPRMTSVIPTGRTGWMRLGPSGSYGVAGIFFNNNLTQGSVGTPFNGGIRLPKLRCGTDTYTLPIFPPSC